jgi:hypothetical protein
MTGNISDMETLDGKLANTDKKSTLILHVGGGKCGSSSLQTFLTSNPSLETTGGHSVEYWILRKNEKSFLTFIPVQTQRTWRGLRYQVSQPLREYWQKSCIHEIFDPFVLSNTGIESKTFVFSYEGWAVDLQSLELKSCRCITTNFETVIYQHVRPQISLMSSAYLQWTLWSDKPSLRETFSLLTKISDWEIQAQNAYKLGADKVLVKYSKDIVQDFCESFGINQLKITNPTIKRINTALPLEAVTLLLRNRQLRQGPHDSEIDFLFEDLISEIAFSPTPIEIKIDKELVTEVEDYFHGNNSKLMARMSFDHAASFQSDLVSSRKRYLERTEAHDLQTGQLNIDFLEKISVLLLSYFRELNQLLNSALAERDALVSERDALVSERDALVSERDALISSRSWRLLSFLRRIVGLSEMGPSSSK